MAAQLFVIYSSQFQGVGVLAGGPYHCARGNVVTAGLECGDSLTGPNVNTLIKDTDERSGNLIDVTGNMSGKNAYVYSGDLDTVISTNVVNAGVTFFEHYGVNATFEKLHGAEHCQPTDDPTNTNLCAELAPPFISYCNYDGAGATLQTIYNGTLKERNNGSPNGTLLTFNQREFGNKRDGIGETGYLYVSSGCAAGEKCMLHIALHGCLQNVDFVGTDYVTRAGYNKWADTNNMIILYPQTEATVLDPTDPEGCWDWWGYTSSKHYDTNEGAQPYIIMEMVNRTLGQ
eukprot:CAMPEP_0201490092 /NCGR_PEP_ID=MMETSP0151_2-20130828/24996_1 /ASSEMBLY_ACC=CAM_ASM_000257 /TAXON_ID=200890 /ORGANISM="Paramoeba atlantica, Strain 621/1 / CCAP 1560/9" /LENGTH=287 /DNA_ID=CAMNT_0047875907 /DNA_START=281 /DNA_END=1144 /DNA_ORIENTATION=-